MSGSDAPLEGNGGVPVEAAFLCLVPDEVVAQFPFGTDGELVVGTVTVHNIEPELWLRQEDESALVTAQLAFVHILGSLCIPQVGEAAEGAQVIGKGDSPHCCGLETGVAVHTVTLEHVLVQGLESEGLAEVIIVPLQSRTHQDALLERTRLVQTAIVLTMGSETHIAVLYLGKGEVAANLPIGTKHATCGLFGLLVSVVHIDEEERTSKFVCLEHLHCSGHLLS